MYAGDESIRLSLRFKYQKAYLRQVNRSFLVIVFELS